MSRVTLDAPSRLLAVTARLMPPRRQEWALAMRAELAALEPGPARWRFAVSCSRAALTRPTTIAAVSGRVLVMAVVVWALVLASQVRYAPARAEVIGMVAVLGAVSWFARHPAAFGPAGSAVGRLVRGIGFVLIATIVLLAVNDQRASSTMDDHDAVDATTTRVVVWTTILALYTIALVRVTAGRSTVTTRTLAISTGVGLAGGLGWLTLVTWQPEVPRSNAAAIAAMVAAAAVAGYLISQRSDDGQDFIGGVWAGVVAATLIAMAMDIVLPLSRRWVVNSAPPSAMYGLNPPHRLADSVTVWLLGALVAAVLAVAIRTRRRPTRELPAAAADMVG